MSARAVVQEYTMAESMGLRDCLSRLKAAFRKRIAVKISAITCKKIM